MEMDDPCLICLHDILRKEHPLCQVTAYFTCHVIPLHTVDSRVFIGILLFHILIVALDQGEDAVVRCVRSSYKGTFEAVSYISSRQVKSPCCHDLVFYHILYLLD